MKKQKFPKCNGRPQLWVSFHHEWDRLRIIFPSGRVSYYIDRYEYIKIPREDKFYRGCTSRSTQEEAVKAAAEWSGSAESFEFLGYL